MPAVRPFKAESPHTGRLLKRPPGLDSVASDLHDKLRTIEVHALEPLRTAAAAYEAADDIRRVTIGAAEPRYDLHPGRLIDNITFAGTHPYAVAGSIGGH